MPEGKCYSHCFLHLQLQKDSYALISAALITGPTKLLSKAIEILPQISTMTKIGRCHPEENPTQGLKNTETEGYCYLFQCSKSAAEDKIREGHENDTNQKAAYLTGCLLFPSPTTDPFHSPQGVPPWWLPLAYLRPSKSFIMNSEWNLDFRL